MWGMNRARKCVHNAGDFFLTLEASSGFASRLNNTTCILAWKVVCDVIYVLAHFTSYTGIQSEVPGHSRSLLPQSWLGIADHTLLPYACLFEIVLGDFRSRKMFHIFRYWGRIKRVFGDMWQLSDDLVAVTKSLLKYSHSHSVLYCQGRLFGNIWIACKTKYIVLHLERKHLLAAFVFRCSFSARYSSISHEADSPLGLVFRCLCTSFKSLSLTSEGFSHVISYHCSSHAVLSVLIMVPYCVCFLWPLYSTGGWRSYPIYLFTAVPIALS